MARLWHGKGTPPPWYAPEEVPEGWSRWPKRLRERSKAASGRWQARYCGPDLAYHSAPTTFQTRGDAQGWLAEERRLISLQQWTSPRDHAVRAATAEAGRRARTRSAYAEAWLAGRVTSSGFALRPSTKAGYRNSLDVHILPTFGQLPLEDITTAAIRSWGGSSRRAAGTPQEKRPTVFSRPSCRPPGRRADPPQSLAAQGRRALCETT